MFLAGTLADLAHYHQTRMDADAYLESNPFFLLQASIESLHRLKYAQTGLTQSYLFFMIVGTLAMLGWMLG